MCLSMASCATTQKAETKKQTRSKEYFSEKDYGVKASPRVADGAKVPKGGGRYMVGKPYAVKGKTYVPKEDPGYNKTGLASWYGSAFHGRLTANGEVYDQQHLSAAHPTFPLPSYARVTNVDTGSSVVVRVNDRGPFHQGRIIDVSNKAAELLDFKRAGTGRVNVQYMGQAPLDGHDMPFLMASYVRKGDRLPSVAPDGQIATGVMVASNDSAGSSASGRARSFATSGSLQTSLSGPTPSNGARPSAFAMMSASTSAAETEAAGTFAVLPSAGPLPVPRPHAGMATTADAAAPVMQMVPQTVSAAQPASRPGVALVWTQGAMPVNP
ncbi:septal ring lytic transglycosylase RlpA family protein [Ectorhizobium quercum]